MFISMLLFVSAIMGVFYWLEKSSQQRIERKLNEDE